MSQKPALAQLREQLARLEHGAESTEAKGLGHSKPLTQGALHEWFGCAGGSGTRGLWHPPLGVLIGATRDAVRGAAGGPNSLVVWVGRACWPYPHALAVRDGGKDEGGKTCDKDDLRGRSLFVDARRPEERVWAIDLALRCRAVAVVVADGSGLGMAESRRLQLAAAGGAGGAGGGGGGSGSAMAFLARPPWEERELSAARTRWRVSPRRTEGNGQAWTVELLRCKGLQPEEDARRWVVRRDHATGAISEWLAERSKGDGGLAAHGSDRPLPQARPA